MADQIAINVKVIDSEVGPKLRAVRDQIKGAFSDAERSAKNLGQTNAGVLKSFEAMKLSALGFGRARVGARLAESGAGARGLVEGLHGLSPVLDSVGLGLSNMRGFAAAARFGLAGFAAVAGGAVIVELTKAGDEAAKLRQRFDDLLAPARRPGGQPAAGGAPGAGSRLFESLKEDAKRLGTTPANLAAAGLEPLIEMQKTGPASLFRAAPGQDQYLPAVKSIENSKKAMVSLYQEMRSGGASNEEATKGANEFFAALEKGGKVTPEIITKLKAVSPAAANAVTSITQFGGTDARRAVEGLARIEPLTRQDFERTQKSNRSLSDATDEAKAKAERLFEPSPGQPGGATKFVDILSGHTPLKIPSPDEPFPFGPDTPQFGPPAPRRDTTGAFRRAIDAAAPERQGQGEKPVDLSGIFGRIEIAGEGLLAVFNSLAQKAAGDGSAPGHASGGGRGFALGGQIRLAGGGIIRGPGTGTSDSIIAAIAGGRGFVRLSNGEGIVNERAMRHLGSNGLAEINGLASGGSIGPSFVDATPRAAASSGKTVEVNFNMGGNTHRATMTESAAEQFVQDSIAYRIASGGRRQSSIS